MMGSNNHIITNSASALSDVTGRKGKHAEFTLGAAGPPHHTCQHAHILYAQTFIGSMKHNHGF